MAHDDSGDLRRAVPDRESVQHGGRVLAITANLTDAERQR
jgi:hypothetical protein